MRALAGIVLALAIAGCGRASLDGTSVRSTPAPVADGAVASDPDGGAKLECVVAADCPGSLPVCDNTAMCGCGCFRTCTGTGRCLSFCDDGPACVPDAGPPPFDSGLAPECRRAADCPPQLAPRACLGVTSPSCAFGACVADCEGGGRTCALDGMGCVQCTVPGSRERFVHCPTCNTIPFDRGVVEETTCGSAPRGTVTFIEISDCRLAAAFSSGAEAVLVPLDQGLMIGHVTGFDTPCLVAFAPTGALRTVWQCPGCSFTVMHR